MLAAAVTDYACERQVSADASARCTAIRKAARSQLPGGTLTVLLVFLLAVLVYYAMSSTGTLPAHWHLKPYLRSLKDPYDFPGSPDAQFAA